MILKSIIVDDEAPSRFILRSTIEESCPELTVVGEAETLDEARNLIITKEPELVFLDIQMPNSTGFDLLQHPLHRYPFYIIFVTAYEKYAINAVKAGAHDYLLKPIDSNELRASIERLYNIHSSASKRESILFPEDLDKTIVLKHVGGFRVIRLKDIIFLEGDNNYTQIYLDGGARLTSSKTLKEYEKSLGVKWFIRTHKSYIANLYHVKEYLTEDGGYIVMNGDKKLPVSRYNMNEMLHFLNKSSFRF